MGAQEKALRISLTGTRDTFDAQKANEQIRKGKGKKPLPTLLPTVPTRGTASQKFDLANPLGMPLSVERDPYARPLGEDLLSDAVDFVGGATFMDGLAPDASRAATLGLGVTAGITPGMLAKTGRGLYSRLLEGFKTSLPKSVKAESVLNLAKKTGATDEELVWSRLEEFLGPRQGQKVDRDELIAHVEANTPKVEAKVLGEPLSPEKQKQLYAIFEESSQGNPQRAAAMEEEFYRRNGGRGTTDPVKYKQHTLPGGENYRETLITLDRRNTDIEEERKRLLAISNEWPPHPEREGAIARLQELHRQDPVNRITGAGASNNEFRSGHYGTPNVLVHALHSDRMTPEGLNVRFLDEVQSDWAQQGKRKGYLPPEGAGKFEVFDPKTGKNIQSFDSAEEAGAFISRWEEENPGKFLDYSTPEIQAADGRVPDRPFKSDDRWGGLMLKQQLTDAAEKGKDGLAWNVGATINDRYKLSKHIDKLEYSPTTGILSGTDRNGQTVVGHVDVTPDKLPEYVGKDVAARLLGTPHTTRMSSNGIPLNLHTLEGANMDIGGTAMTQFYDGVLRKEAERLLKPFGGQVERGAVMGAPIPSDSYGELAAVGGDVRRYSPDVVDRNALPEPVAPQHPAWLARLTPEIRKQILEKGFPLALYMALMGQSQPQQNGPQQAALAGSLGRQ